MFEMNIVSIDFYMTKPVSPFDVIHSKLRNFVIQKVPIIRMFGNSLEGKKCCLFIHNVFPYIYIPFEYDNINEHILQQLAASIDKALNIALCYKDTVQHVYEIEITKKKSIYGYHENEQTFLKIFLFEPYHISKLEDLLLSGSIFNQRFQPYESHVPYILQFCMDNNLYGMNNIKFNKIKFRNEDGISLNKLSYCELEGDVIVYDIIKDISDSNLKNPGLRAIWKDEEIRRNKMKMSSDIKPKSSQTRLPKLYNTEKLFKEKLKNNINQKRKTNDTFVFTQNSSLDRTLQLDEMNCTLDNMILDELNALAENENKNVGAIDDDSILGTQIIQDEEEQVQDVNEDWSNEIKPIIIDESIMDTSKQVENEDNQAGAIDKESILGTQILPDEHELDIHEERNDELKPSDESLIDYLNTTNHVGNESKYGGGIDEDSILGTQIIPDEHDLDVHEEWKDELKPIISNESLIDDLNTTNHVGNESQYGGAIDEDSILGTQIIPDEHDLDVHEEWHDELKPIISDESLIDDLNTTNQVGNESKYGGDIDEDSILGTHIKPDGHEVDVNEVWNDEFKPIITEKSFLDTTLVVENDAKSNAAVDDDIFLSQFKQDEEPNLSQDIVSNDSIFDTTLVNLDKLIDVNYRDVKGMTNTSNHLNKTEVNSGIVEESIRSLQSSSDLFEPLTQQSINQENLSGTTQLDLKSFEKPTTQLYQMVQNEPKTKYSEFDFKLSEELERTIISDEHIKDKTETSLSRFIKMKQKPIKNKDITEELFHNSVNNILAKEPFYSDLNDISNNELSNKFLHLDNAPVSILEEHKSQFSGISNWRCKRRSCLNIFAESGQATIIKPIQKPPSSKAVTRWVKCKEVLKRNEEKTKLKKVEPIIEHVEASQSSQKGVLKLDYFNEIETSQHSENTNDSIPSQPNSQNKPKTNRSSIDDMFLSSPSPDSRDVSSNESIQKDLLKSFIRKQLITPKRRVSDSLAIDAMTPNNTGDFQMGLENLYEATANVENYYLTVLAVEIHAISRAQLKPDPAYDEVKAIFYYLYTCPPQERREHGIFLTGAAHELNEIQTKPIHLHFVSNEYELFTLFLSKVRVWDPDILIGYEIEMLSWGYLLERGYVLELNLNQQLSRISEVEKTIQDEFKSTELKIPGRIVINLWKLLRHEVTLQSYSFENIMYHVLHERVPLHSFSALTCWWEHRTHLYKWMTAEHYLIRVCGIIRLIEQLDLIGRTSELARLFGIQFYEVLSRGSQFRVESMMLRLSRLNNFIALSPSIKQRAHMRAPESLPLILEPESQLYTDPVIVLDFQSLYPSVIIAYNYCFSTCLGRVEHLGLSDSFQFGCVNLEVPTDLLKRLEPNINISPAGVAFVNKTVRVGILPQMLQEILDTRLMVKKSMKEYKKDQVALQRVLHARQLGLKLIANVTYGYTAANFSGRMPSVEVGDSVVSKGRETLQKAIETVNNTPKWGCRVIYGDTDSLFVLAPGKTKQEAFEIGKDIAEVVTNNNPTPVKLKFEKVYQPCILQTKKRYVGFMYETVDQEKPVYEAKGIETVRRDGCPAVSKILKKSLCILFETKDLSSVKKYVEKQFSKIIAGRVSIQDLTFAKEYRGMAGYKPGACVPALSLARKWISTDSRAEPRVGERVPYIIVAGAPGLPLIKLVKSPHEVLEDTSLRPNAEYYITRVIIPPLERCFLLIGTPILPWYTNLPRKIFIYLPTLLSERKTKTTISQYFATVNCVSCNEITQNKKGVCDACIKNPKMLACCLYYKIHDWQRCNTLVSSICSSCVGRNHHIECSSLDCPVLYKKGQIERDLQQMSYVLSLCDSHLSLF